MPSCTPSWIASQSQYPRRRTATPVVSLRKPGRDSLLKDCPPSLFRPNMGHTWTPKGPTYFLPTLKVSHSGNWALIAIGTQHAIGIDVGTVRDKVEYEGLSKSFFYVQGKTLIGVPRAGGSVLRWDARTHEEETPLRFPSSPKTVKPCFPQARIRPRVSGISRIPVPDRSCGVILTNSTVSP